MIIADFFSLISQPTAARPFKMLVKTDNAGTSASNQFTIPVNAADFTGFGGTYSVDWGDGSAVESGLSASVTHTFPAAGNYVISISGSFHRLYFNNAGDKSKLLEIQQWGTIVWRSFARFAWGCNNMTVTATDAPSLSLATSFEYAFSSTGIVSIPGLASWAWAGTTNYYGLFQNASLFNQSLGGLNMTAANNIGFMFTGTAMNTANYDATLNGWAEQNVLSTITIQCNGRTYTTAGKVGRDYLTGTKGWTITGDTLVA